jgi:hypothetical protein
MTRELSEERTNYLLKVVFASIATIPVLAIVLILLLNPWIPYPRYNLSLVVGIEACTGFFVSYVIGIVDYYERDLVSIDRIPGLRMERDTISYAITLIIIFGVMTFIFYRDTVITGFWILDIVWHFALASVVIFISARFGDFKGRSMSEK